MPVCKASVHVPVCASHVSCIVIERVAVDGCDCFFVSKAPIWWDVSVDSLLAGTIVNQ